MKRDASIHVLKSEFTKAAIKMGFSLEEVDELVLRLKAHSISTRTVTVSTDRIEKKTNRLMESSRLDAALLAQLIYAIRKQKKHRGISPIRSGSRDWGILKEVTAHALDFSIEFKLSKREGFLNYVKIGLSKMGKFGITKYLNMYEAICETHIANQEIQDDNDPQATRGMYDYYTKIIAQKTGTLDRIDELPEKYVWFVRARKQADEMKVNPNVYIMAQFEALDFAKGIPHPVQMVGPKAADRVTRYAFKQGITTDREGVSDRAKLKKIFQ